MEWITEPSAGAEPMCNNCFFYAHGSCSTKCSSQFFGFGATPYGVHRLFKDILASSA